MMDALIRAAIEHKRLVLSLLALILLAGSYAYVKIPKENNPDIQFPFFSVSLSHDGISPEDAERMIIKPLERHLKTIEGVKEMRATGFEGGASIVLEFLNDVNPDRALQDVREAVDMGKADLPSETDEPIVQEYSAGKDPILTIVLYGDAPERTMVRLAEDLKDRLESIPSVLEAQLGGKREEVLEVIVDPTKIETYDVSLSELLSVVQNNNRLIAAGALQTGDGRFSVKVPGLFEDARDVISLPVKTTRDGVVTLGDLGDARRTFKDATSLAHFNGRPAISVEVIKRVATNTVETAEAAKAVTRMLSENWPNSVQYEFLGDNSVYVSEFLGTLRNSVLSAVALVAIVIVAALGWRSATLVGITIPGAFLCGILALYALGYTINTVVLFGLILAVGLLVDGAIVVSELADRKMLEGFSSKDAFRIAAQRMAWPIIASTVTTLLAFTPLLFWPGILGDFMSYLPLTLIFTLTGSLLMALIFLPTLGALIGKPGEGDPDLMEHLAGDQEFRPQDLKGITGWYARSLAIAIRYPGRIMALTFLALIGAWTLFITDNNGQILFPSSEPNSARVLVHARGNFSITQMNKLVSDVENRLMDIEGVENRYTRIGAGSGQAEDVIGRITLLLADWDKRRPAREIEMDIRQRVANIPGIRIEFLEEQQGPVQGKSIQIEVTSDVPALLTPAIAKIRDHLDSMPGLVDQEDSRPVPGIEWRLDVDRSEAGRYETNVTTIGSFIQLVTNGALVGHYRPDEAEDEVDIRVRFPYEDRGIMALDTLRIPTPLGSVPISNFVTRTPHQQTGTIDRLDGARVMSVATDVLPGVQPAQKVSEIRSWIADQNFDPRLKVSFAGEDEIQQESGSFLIGAFFIALFGMGVVLLAQFNSFYNAGLVLTSVVLSTVGAVFGLWLLDRPFVIVMTGVGIIALAGIVVNNNIVLIDTYDRLVKSGIKPMEAIVRTGTQRLRPVMLTTITTVIGLLPMVFQFNIDFFTRSLEIGSPTSFVWVDLALAIVFGLSFATILTLVITPSLLAWRIIHSQKRAAKKANKLGKKEQVSLPRAAE